MKIIHIAIACFYIENLEYQENVLPRIHKRLGLEVDIITTQYSFERNYNIQKKREPGQYINSDGIPVTVLKYKKEIQPFKFLGIKRVEPLYEKIETIAPDIIFIHGCQFYDIKEVIKYKKKYPRVKLFVDNHADFINTPVNTWKRKLYYYLITGHFARSIEKHVERFWGVTPSRIKYLRDIYGLKSNKLDLLVMGGDETKIDFTNKETIKDKIRNKYKISDNDFLIVTGGKIDKKKNIHLLLECFKQLPISIKLIIFGEPDKEMISCFDNISSNIRLIGWIESSETYNLFLASDLGIFPGTHSVLWEQAIASGLPCIFKYWEGMDHVDIGGNAIILKQPSNDKTYINDLSILISELSKKDSKYNEMKKTAENKGREVFSYTQIAKKSILFQ